MNKYRNKPFVDEHGIRWHSQGEARRYAELKLLERAGKIESLQRQVAFDLSVAGSGGTVGRIIVDFVYLENGKRVCEDFKSVTPALSAWKMKHFRLQYGIDILITRASNLRKR